MPSRHDDVRDRLQAIAEELAERSLERLRAAIDDGDPDGDGPDTAAVAEEKVLTRARRAVEKAVHLLDGIDAGTAGEDG
jgi:hypothetical protein